MAKEATLISDLPKRPSGRILRAAEAGAWQDGFSFLAVARREADLFVKAARQEYAREFEIGYHDGKSKGETEARRLINEAVVKVDRYLGGIENEVINLALDVVKRVLGELDVNALVARAARQAIAELRQSKYLAISVHPDAAKTVRDELRDIFLSDENLNFRVEIRADATLARDACTVSTDVAVIDARIGAQLDAIAAAVAATTETQS
jgi:type III secretion protein L